jgi:hypothetical protein
MNFTLVYDGELITKSKWHHKQEIRRKFHRQLRELWKHTPLHDLQRSPDLIKRFGPFNFFPLVCEARNEAAELQITMLRTARGPGHIVTQNGDIDNGLKILFDSLRIPNNVQNELPTDQPGPEEDPFFCLLEDDKLITKVAVSTDRLLEADRPKSYIRLFIHVQIVKIQPIGTNMILSF